MINTRTDRGLKILLLTSDHYPPIRPAAKAIFGEEFAARGHSVDCLMQASDAATAAGVYRNGGGRIYLAATKSGDTRLQRMKKYLLAS